MRRSIAFTVDLLLVLILAAAVRVSDLPGLLVLAALYQAALRLRTPGRWIARVVVLRADGTDVGTIRAGLRTLAYAPSAAPLGLGFLWAIRDRRGRALHDRLLGTVPVRHPAGTPLRRRRVILTLAIFLLLPVAASRLGGGDARPFEALPLADLRAHDLPDGKLAMVAFMLNGSDQSEDTWRTTLRRMRQMGVQVVEIGQIAWSDMEPEPRRYRWGYAETLLRINEEEGLGLEFVADIGMFINPGLDGRARLPEHLAGKAYDDPAVVEALAGLYEAFLRLRGAGRVTYLFQHFENAEASLRDHPEDKPRVQTLLRRTFARAKALRPDLKTGVCIQQYEKPHWPQSMIQDWNVAIGTDVVPIISFGPSHFTPEGDPARTRAEFEEVLKGAPGLRIALNECGHNSSRDSGSSDEAQAAFVRELFALLRDRHSSIEFATWYEFGDLDPLAATALGAYLATLAGNPLATGYFAANMGSCGLLTHDGRAKPSAAAWCEEAARYHREREKR